MRRARPWARRSLVVRVGLAAVAFAALLAVMPLSGCGGPKVPDVVGKQPADAIRTLEDAGYKLGRVSYGSTPGAQLGSIGSQSPAAGEKLREGQPVDLQVNAYDDTTAIVPDVIEQPQSTAEDIVKQCGLLPVVSFQYIETVAKDEVITQSPSPGAKAGIGAPVILVVSAGPQPEKTAVPNVVGKAEADALKAIEGAGLKGEAYDAYSDTVAKGKVIAEVPEAGAKVSPGSTVQFVVSLGKGTGAVKVPNVTGKKEADAMNAIKSAGLKGTVFRQNSDTVAAGVVIQQFPTAGSTTAAGGGVAIVVSLGKASTQSAVPDVMGKTQADAQAALTAAGFVPTVQSVDASGGADVVIYQFPAAGTQAPNGSSVLVAVGKAATTP